MRAGRERRVSTAPYLLSLVIFRQREVSGTVSEPASVNRELVRPGSSWRATSAARVKRLLAEEHVVVPVLSMPT
jgi:hypothetical protein